MNFYDALMLVFCAIGLLIGVLLVLIALIPLCMRWKAKLKFRKIKDAAAIEGVVTDADVVQNLTKMEYHYKYALEYYDADVNLCHTYLGITSNQPLQIAVGMKLPLRIVEKPLLRVSQETLEGVRSASERLPAQVHFHEWENAPLDETATIMMEQDYQRIRSTMNSRIRTRGRTAFFLILFGVILVGVFLFGFWYAEKLIRSQI
ncbi:MAG: hypothetical protein MJ062_00135 [Oscillospiraceae bacterium]|nr:hypothetical protein [Oscillospiraceae bacterium]